LGKRGVASDSDTQALSPALSQREREFGINDLERD
jgi:hypothetical protein